MNNTFEIIGKISISKETDKFRPYTDDSSNGWRYNKLLFNVQSDVNRHLLEIGGTYKENGTGVIKTFSKGSVDPNTHEKLKGERIEIAWRDRNKPEVLEKVAEFKKFVIDLEKYGRRYELQNALKKQQEGNLSKEEFEQLGVANLEQALEDSKKKRKEFISEYDFAEFIHKLILSGKIDGKLFRILGDIELSEYNGKIYKKFKPNRLYLVDDNTEQTSTGQIQIFFNKDSLDKGSLKDKKRLYINGYVRNYDNQRKDIAPFPITLVIDASSEDERVQKVVKLLESQFTVKDKSWKEFGVKVKILNGSQRVRITEDMLSDFQREMLELGMTSMEELEKEILHEKGEELYGERVEEMVIVNVAKGYTNGRKDTVYVDEDFVLKPIERALNTNKTELNEEESSEELFSDLDDIL